MGGLHVPLLNDRLVHLVAMLSCSLLPSRYCALIQPICVNNSLHWTSVGQQYHHGHHHFHRCAQSFHHGASSCAKRLLTRATAISLGVRRVNTNIARSDQTFGDKVYGLPTSSTPLLPDI